MTPTSPEGGRRRAVPLGRWLRRHGLFLLLLALLAWHCGQTFGVYVISDDITWLRRTVADAHRPWNALVEPLFSNYYRPVWCMWCGC